jgi:cell division protein ZapD
LSELILYEFPLNERIRVFMRLEQLFLQSDHFMNGQTVWDCRTMIASLLDILAILGRNDLKSGLLKELERHSTTLARMAESGAVDRNRLRNTLDELAVIGGEIYDCCGRLGGGLMESELFKSISQRGSIPGGSCVFDLPAYHYWLGQAEEIRHRQLEQWVQSFQTLRRAITLILRLIRLSAMPTEEIAQGGFFQQNLDKALPYQLIRVGVRRDLPHYAEISGGKQRFTVRFMTFETSARPSQTEEDIPFQLTCCAL